MTAYNSTPLHPLPQAFTAISEPHNLKCPDAPVKEQRSIARTRTSEGAKVNFELPMKRKRDSYENYFMPDHEDVIFENVHRPHVHVDAHAHAHAHAHVQQVDVDRNVDGNGYVYASSAKKKLDFGDIDV